VIAVLVLAAGGSRRMGRPKMLLPLPGGTVLATVVSRLLAAPVDRIVVVLGHGSAEVRARAGLPPDARVTVVDNPDWNEGLSSSLKRGLLACPEADALVVALGDQPAVDVDVVRRLVEAWRRGARLAVPVRGEPGGPAASRAGHPVLFDRSLRDELLSLRGDVGARDVLRAHWDEAARVEAPSLSDLDTEEDYRAFLEGRTAAGPQGLELPRRKGDR
jgi:molybdenum cofactor cytidylyltransferase